MSEINNELKQEISLFGLQCPLRGAWEENIDPYENYITIQRVMFWSAQASESPFLHVSIWYNFNTKSYEEEWKIKIQWGAGRAGTYDRFCIDVHAPTLPEAKEKIVENFNKHLEATLHLKDCIV